MLREAAVGVVGIVLICSTRRLGAGRLAVGPCGQLEHASSQLGVVLDVRRTLFFVLSLKNTHKVFVSDDWSVAML